MGDARFREAILESVRRKADDIFLLSHTGVAVEAWLQVELWLSLVQADSGDDECLTEATCFGKRVDLGCGRDGELDPRIRTPCDQLEAGRARSRHMYLRISRRRSPSWQMPLSRRCI